ncbi:MAG: sugar phosphate isomerase/epimerase [Planctomyces sp.]|nr:sugar phosphate isomerase/epimerase [Planctomyces sp.]
MANSASSPASGDSVSPASVEPASAERRAARWMARLSINQMTTPRWSLEEDLEHYAAAGIAGIGINWQKFDDDAAPSDAARVRESPLRVSSLGWCGGFTGCSGQSFRETMLDARRKLRVARQLGASALVVIPGPQLTHIRSHAARLTMDALRELADAAAESSIRIAVQPMHELFRRGWTFLHTLEDTLALLDRVKRLNTGFCFGAYHLWKEPNLTSVLQQAIERIALVQLSDWREPPRCENDRLVPGDGCIPLASILRTLERGGYRGWYEIEVWSRDLWKRDHGDLMDLCRQRYQQLGAEVQRSLSPA